MVFNVDVVVVLEYCEMVVIFILVILYWILVNVVCVDVENNLFVSMSVIVENFIVVFINYFISFKFLVFDYGINWVFG